MNGHMAAATERALKAWKPGSDLNKLAVAHGINPSTLYRALLRAGLIQRVRYPKGALPDSR